MSRAPRLEVLTLALSVWLLGACVFGGDSDDPEVTATVEVTSSATSAVATSEPTGAATATVAAPATATATSSQVSDGDSVPRSEVGVMLIEVGAGTPHTVYEGRSLFWPGDSFFPTFAGDGSVWVPASATAAGVQRFSTTDGWTDAIDDAWGVSTSSDGRQVAHYRGEADGSARDLVIRGPSDSLLVPGDVVKHEFSPDGTRVAYYLRNEDNSADLYVIDLATGDSRRLAADIDPCACDWTPGPSWSPSGAYLAYLDYGRSAPDGPDGGSFVVAAAGGEPVRTLWSGDWLSEVTGDQLVVGSNDEVGLFDAATGEFRPFGLDAVDALGGSFWTPLKVGRLPFVQVVSDAPGERLTWLIDGVSGEPVVSWPVVGAATMTANGPVLAIDAATTATGIERSCGGVSVVHATLHELGCVPGADRAVWSPDGSYLGLSGRDGAGEWVGVWSPLDGLFLRVEVPRPATSIRWNATGSEALVTWGWSPL